MSTHVVTVTRALAAPIDAAWAVVNDTSRYGEWVDGVLEVVRHHGPGTVGLTYEERNRTLGPLTATSVWTVREVEAPYLRVDSGEGFAPLQDLTSTFRLTARGEHVTELTYETRFRLGLGPLGPVLAAVLRRSLTAEFHRSLDRLDALLRRG